MVDAQEKYDELSNIISVLNYLISDISDSKYKELLLDVKEQAEDDIETYEEKLQEEYEKEQDEMEKQYRRSVL